MTHSRKAIPANKARSPRHQPGAHAPRQPKSEDNSPAGTLLRLQNAAGNRVATRQIAIMREGETTTAEPPTGEKAPEGDKAPTLFWAEVEGEEVLVADTAEWEEAKTLVKQIKTLYGIKLDSAKGIEAIKDQYDDVPESVTNSLEKRRWRMIDLRSLAKCLEHYAPILGSERDKSTRSGSDQEVTSIGKVKQAINQNTSSGKLDTTTLGEYFKATKTVNLFQAQEGGSTDFPGDEGKQLVGTFVHEMAHGVLSYAYDDFVKSTGGYWKGRYKKSGKRGVEAPLTSYACTNAQEDLAETAMFYFVEPDSLLNGRGGKKGKVGNPSPLRYAFMQKITNEWLPPPPPVKSEAQPEGPITSSTVTTTPVKPKKKPFWKLWK